MVQPIASKHKESILNIENDIQWQRVKYKNDKVIGWLYKLSNNIQNAIHAKK